MAKLNVNGKIREFEAEPDTPLLWVLARAAGPDRHQVRMRHRAVRRLHRAHRRRADPQLRHPGVGGQRRRRRSSRSKAFRPTARIRCRRPGSRSTCRNAASASRGMIMAAAALLKEKPQPDRRRHRRGDDQHLPLRHLQPGARRDQGGREGRRSKRAGLTIQYTSTGSTRHDDAITVRTPLPRHAASLTGSSSVAGFGGLVVPFTIPLGVRADACGRAQACRNAPEINAWVVVQAGRHRRHPHRALRDGPGHADRPRATGRRRARCDWAQGHDRIPDAGRRTSRAIACGAISRPAAAAASASRTSTCARAAPPRG